MAAKRAAKKAPVKPVESGRHDGVRKPAVEVLADLAARGLANDVSVIALRYACTPLEVCSTSRQAPIPDARADLWNFLYERAGWSYPRIGEIFDADHSTIITHLQAWRKRTAKRSKT